MKDYHVIIYEGLELLYVAFEMSLVFLRVKRNAPRTCILVVARAASAVSKSTAKSLASQCILKCLG